MGVPYFAFRFFGLDMVRSSVSILQPLGSFALPRAPLSAHVFLVRLTQRSLDRALSPQWGWMIGVLLFAAFATLGFVALCCFNCCGRVRLWQRVFRRRRDAMPFMDMVSNRFTMFSYNAILFVYPFCLLSTFVM